MQTCAALVRAVQQSVVSAVSKFIITSDHVLKIEIQGMRDVRVSTCMSQCTSHEDQRCNIHCLNRGSR